MVNVIFRRVITAMYSKDLILYGYSLILFGVINPLYGNNFIINIGVEGDGITPLVPLE